MRDGTAIASITPVPVDTKHDDVLRFEEAWRNIRDALEGPRAIKGSGERYLPRLTEQSNEEYDSYKLRAQFFNATKRTLTVLVGSVFRKNPTFNQSGLDDFLEDATLAGDSFYDYLKHTSNDVFSVGRFGTLIDWSDQTASPRPILCGYCAENIINWHIERVEDRMTLTLLVLHELSDDTVELGGSIEQATDDGYEKKLVDQWRVLRLVPTTEDENGKATYFVQCEVYRKESGAQQGSAKGQRVGGPSGTTKFVKIDTRIPTRRGIPLNRIPFVFHGPERNTPGIEQPPLEDLVEINLSHYRTSADLEHGRHFTGLPQPWAAGFDYQGELKIGSSAAWITENANAKVGYLEFSGQGLGALKEAIEEKERQMAALGARMLFPESKDAEAYDTVRIKQAGETSALMAGAIALGQSMTHVLRWVAWWSGTSEKIEQEDKTSVEVNTEFIAATLRPEEITALVAAWQAEAISWETLMFNFRRGELYPDDFDTKEERTRIQNDVEQLMRNQVRQQKALDGPKPDKQTGAKDDAPST